MMEEHTHMQVEPIPAQPEAYLEPSSLCEHETFTEIKINTDESEEDPPDVTRPSVLSPSAAPSLPHALPFSSPQHPQDKVNAKAVGVPDPYYMIAFNSRNRDEEFRQLSTEDQHLSIVPKPPVPPPRPTQGTDRATLYCAIIFVVIVLLAFLRAGERTVPSSQISKNVPPVQSAATGITDEAVESRVPTMGSEQHWRTPKILWVLTSVQVDGLGMTEGTAARHLMHVGKKSGFDVRVVDVFTAYGWLSPQMAERVRVAKHKSKYMLAVEELLRVALLVEHGGLFVRFPRYIFPGDLEWLYQILEQPQKALLSSQKEGLQYCEGGKDAEVVLFYEKGQDGSRNYEDWVVFARKESKLLSDIFAEMSELVQSGSWQYKYLVDIEERYDDIGVKFVKNMLSELINFRQLYWFTGDAFCKEYHVVSIDKDVGKYVLKISDENTLRNQVMGDRKAFFDKYGQVGMIESDLGWLNINIAQVLVHELMGLAHQDSVFRNDIMGADDNKWMMRPKNKTREVGYCVLSLKPLPTLYAQHLQSSLDRLNMQSYKNWHAVYFVQGLAQSEIQHSPSVKLVNSSDFEGLNLQRGAVKQCALGEVVVLLDYDEWLGHENDLFTIQAQMRVRDNFGAFLSFKFNNQIYKSRFAKEDIRRRVNHPNLPLLQEVAHHFRIFTTDAYRLVPHMALHDNAGRYFDKEVALLTVLEMGWNYKHCYEAGMVYHTKRVEQAIDIPKERVVLPHSFIVTPKLREVDITKQEYTSKFASRTICESMRLWNERKKKDMRRFFILNDGAEFVGYQDRKDLPQVIEKKIHQIWVGQEMPKFKQFLTQKVKESHPDYEYFLWTNDNITRQNFPVSFDMISTLLQFNNQSRYNKLSMVSDLMRAEIVLNHGGIYLDTNYFVFAKNSFDDWLSYRGVFATQLYPYHRFHREGSIFAAPKDSPALRRLVDHRAISSRNYYSKSAHIEAGPSFFSSTVQAQEELDPSILQPSFEHLFPYYPWDNSKAGNLCEAPYDINEKELLFKGKRAYRANCANLYPWALGINFWDEGKSWV